MRAALVLSTILAFACAAPTCIPTPGPGPVPTLDASPDVEVVLAEAGPEASPDAAAQPDAPTTPCSRACANRVRLACPVGPNCEATCQHALATKLIPGFDPACVYNAQSKAQISKCVGVTCP